MLIVDMPMQNECCVCRFWRICTDNTNFVFDGHNIADKAERCIIKGELVRCDECKHGRKDGERISEEMREQKGDCDEQ